MPRENLNRLLGLILLVTTIGVYWYVLHCDFVFFDDPAYVTDNSRVRSGFNWQNVVWAFTAFSASNWHPLTWLSHMLDCDLYGLNPAGHHMTNLLFHVGNTLLLFLFLREATGKIWRSFVVAMLFSVHPLHVESVAWVSERKDVLSTFFCMLALLAYLRYVRQPGFGRYLGVLLLFAFGLLAKPMLVTLPFVLLLLDYWPLGRLSVPSEALRRIVPYMDGAITPKPLHQLILEKIPFFILSAASSVVTWMAQSEAGAVVPLEWVPFEVRMANAFVSYVRYAYSMLWPDNLAIFYPHPGASLSPWFGAASALLLTATSAALFHQASRCPYLFVGWFWYVGTLIPVIGFVQVGDQAMADRYTYIPSIGLFIAMVWGLADLFEHLKVRRVFAAALVCTVLFALIVQTRAQLRTWQTTTSLFEHALKVTHNNYAAHFILSQLHTIDGDSGQALFHYNRAVELNPSFVAKMHNRTGYSFAEQGHLDMAVTEFVEAIQIASDYANAHNNLGVVLARKGLYEEALSHLAEALRISPGNAKIMESIRNVEADSSRTRLSTSENLDGN